jgi:hypothetical protein
MPPATTLAVMPPIPIVPRAQHFRSVRRCTRPTSPVQTWLLIPRSKTDAAGEGAEIGIAKGARPVTCPVRALAAWLVAAGIADGPVFRRVTPWGKVGDNRLTSEAVRLILNKRAAAAGIKGTLLEPVTPHGMRAGFVTTAYTTPMACWTKRSWPIPATAV